MAGSWVNITTSFEVAGVTLQDKLDGAFPGVLTLLFVLLCWWLMSKKKMSAVKVMALMIVIAVVGVLLGIFDPGLSYGSDLDM